MAAASTFDVNALRVAHERPLTRTAPREDAIRCGLASVHELTGHLRTGSIVVLNGRTGGGKTTTLLSLGLRIPTDPINQSIGISKVIYWGLEMTREQERSKLLCGLAEVSWNAYMDQKTVPMSDREREAFDKADDEWGPIIDRHLEFPDVSHGGKGEHHMNVTRFCNAIKFYARQGHRVHILDPLKLLDKSDTAGKKSFDQEDEALRRIHTAAVRNNVLVILGNQMIKSSTGKQGTLADTDYADFGGSAMYKEISWHFLFIRRAMVQPKRLKTDAARRFKNKPQELEIPGLMVLEKAKDRGKGDVGSKRYLGFRDGLVVDIDQDLARAIADEHVRLLNSNAEIQAAREKAAAVQAEKPAARQVPVPATRERPSLAEYDGREDDQPDWNAYRQEDGGMLA